MKKGNNNDSRPHPCYTVGTPDGIDRGFEGRTKDRNHAYSFFQWTPSKCFELTHDYLRRVQEWMWTD